MIENVFVLAAVAAATIAMGTLSLFIVRAQRYQAGLDLSTHNAVRDLVAEGAPQNPRSLAKSDLVATFAGMGLATTDTTVSVSYAAGRCGAFAVKETKVLNVFWDRLITIRLTSDQKEPADPLASGLEGAATCIGA